MTRLPSSDPVGVQEPRLRIRPPSTSTDSGQDALRLADAAGIELIPWQESDVVDICAENGNEWAASAAADVVSRQNGKGGVLEVRALAGVVLFGERRILWTAHADKTAEDAHTRMTEIFEGSPSLRKRLAAGRTHGVLHGKGSRAIKLKGGAEIFFFTRSPNAGRGLWADCLFLDEALDVTDGELSVLRYTLRTSRIRTGRRAQTVYTSTPPDEEKHPNGVVFARLRQRALSGRTRSVCWIEHSVPSLLELQAEAAAAGRRLAGDPRLSDGPYWLQGNPSLGYLFDLGTLRADLEESGERGFLVEGLAAPDFWPDPDASDDGEAALDVDVWTSRRDAESVVLDPVALGLEVSLRQVATFSVAGWRADGRKHGEQVWSGPASAAVAALQNIIGKVDPAVLVVDSRGKGGSLLPEIRAAGLDPQVLTAGERSQADEGLARDIENDELRLPGAPMPEMDAAAESVTWRQSGDIRFFDRQAGAAGISPMVSLSLARFGLLTVAAQPPRKSGSPPPEAIAAGDSITVGGERDLMTIGF